MVHVALVLEVEDIPVDTSSLVDAGAGGGKARPTRWVNLVPCDCPCCLGANDDEEEEEEEREEGEDGGKEASVAQTTGEGSGGEEWEAEPCTPETADLTPMTSAAMEASGFFHEQQAAKKQGGAGGAGARAKQSNRVSKKEARKQERIRKATSDNALPRKVQHDEARRASKEQLVREQHERTKGNRRLRLGMRQSLYWQQPPAATSAAASRVQRVGQELGIDAATMSLLMALQHRDITPNDYDTLLQLDQSVKPQTLDRRKLRVFPTAVVGARGEHAEKANCAGDSCMVCLVELEVGDEIRILPCGHVYHAACIDRWLGESSSNCPVDGLSLKDPGQ